MNTSFFLIAATTCFAVAAFADDGDLKSRVSAAAQKVAEQSSYRWTTTVKSEGGGPFGGSALTHGQIEKDGYLWVNPASPQAGFEFARKAGKAAVVLDGNWMTLEEAAARTSAGG